jgi:hypothetical protein
MDNGLLKKTNYLTEYEALEKAAKKSYMLIIKFNQTLDYDILTDVKYLLIDMKERENQALISMIQDLSNNVDPC